MQSMIPAMASLGLHLPVVVWVVLIVARLDLPQVAAQFALVNIELIADSASTHEMCCK